ncbi:MAG: BrxA/BrxB family bacilliredoxin [Bacteroidetes bacterium]|nr:BrxA/BrxB family bacilliredoxin [Bacteroidota bacterium]
MYPESLVKPMKEELTQVGFEECLSPEAVEATLSKKGTVLMVVNSVCGCAAGACRPGVAKSLQHAKKPHTLSTVFAGFDTEAVAQARKHFAPYPPSSPAIALFKDGQLVHFIERHNIEGRTAFAIAEHLQAVYDEFC